MRTAVLIIGIFLILAGAVLLIDQMGILDQLGINLGAILLPLLLILVGIWVLVSVFANRGRERTEQLTIQREGINQAEVRINLGAGRININASDQTGLLLDGKFGGGVVLHDKTSGDSRTILLDSPGDVIWHFPMNSGFNWDIALCTEIPINLDIKTGAGEAFLDLERFNLSALHLQTGAGAVRVTFPSHPGLLHANIRTGVGELILTVPPNVPARFNAGVGLGDFKRDRTRFIRVGAYYQTEDFDQAQNKIDIVIKTGIGSVTIR
jgi:hypothetical protein